MMEPNGVLETTCKHSGHPHTVWYWIDDPNDPVPAPYSMHFDNLEDAMQMAVETWIKNPSRQLRWIKVFRSDNEMYTCFYWKNPTPVPVREPDPVTVDAFKRRWWQRRR